MSITKMKSLLKEELKKNRGLLRFAPCWVARNFIKKTAEYPHFYVER